MFTRLGVGGSSRSYGVFLPKGGSGLTILPQTFEFDENKLAGSAIGTVVATDDVGVTSFLFTATGTGTSADSFFTIDNSGNLLITSLGVASVHNDYETLPNTIVYAITVGNAEADTAVADITLNTLNVDDTAPVLTSPTATGITEQAATAYCITDTAEGTMYMVLVPDGDAPSVAQIKLGQQSSGAAALASKSEVITSSGINIFPPISGLSVATSYEFFFVHTDTIGNDSLSATVGFTTLAEAPEPGELIGSSSISIQIAISL